MRFKKGMALRGFILILFSCLNLLANSQNGYTIKGYVDGLNDGDTIVMRLLTGSSWKDFAVPDSAYVKDGVFNIRGIVPEGPRLYWLTFVKQQKHIRLFIDNAENIIIRIGSINTIYHSILEHHVTIDGSPSHRAWQSLFPAMFNYQQSILSINKGLEKIRDSIGFDFKLVDGIINTRQLITENLYWTIFNNPEPDHIIAIPFISYMQLVQSDHASYWMNVYDGLNHQLKNSFYGKLLKERIPLCIGQQFPVFNLPSVEGKLISMIDILKKSKLTIVQFWADGSYQVDNYQKELLSLYKKYHDKGLNIIGVSSDTIINKWKAGIIGNDLPWYNISDLKGSDGVVGKVYLEYGNPKMPNTTNVLIGQTGEIIAWDVAGPELQWYLWKTFGE